MFKIPCQNKNQMVLVTVIVILLKLAYSQQQFEYDDKYESFSPVVNHRCDRGQMVITVMTQKPFYGVIHPKDYRLDSCIAHGTGSYTTTLTLPLNSDKYSSSYCGVQTTKASLSDITIAVVVRVHPTLELSEDKHFILSCGKSGFRNARNETSRVALNFFHNGKQVKEMLYDQQYELRATMTKPDKIHKLKVRSCLSFSGSSPEVPLIDSNGCPLTHLISTFLYNESSHTAYARFSAFKFPESSKINVQCDIALCRGKCEPGPCASEVRSHALTSIRNGTDDSQSLLASTSAFVLEPGDPLLSPLESCTEWRFPWLIGLCICLAILLLVMLIVNIFLCSSLTCTCTKTEVMDREPSEMDDYDPYRVGWANGSHYGSRTSLHKPGYNSGGSTLNSTARSISNASDHYAIVNSRPGSRYSHQENHLRKSPGSILSSGHDHYGGRM